MPAQVERHVFTPVHISRTHGVHIISACKANPGGGFRPLKTTRMTIDPDAAISVGRVDAARVDATTGGELAQQSAADEQVAAHDAARSAAHHAAQFAERIRRRLGLI